MNLTIREIERAMDGLQAKMNAIDKVVFGKHSRLTVTRKETLLIEKDSYRREWVRYNMAYREKLQREGGE